MLHTRRLKPRYGTHAVEVSQHFERVVACPGAAARSSPYTPAKRIAPRRHLRDRCCSAATSAASPSSQPLPELSDPGSRHRPHPPRSLACPCLSRWEENTMLKRRPPSHARQRAVCDVVWPRDRRSTAKCRQLRRRGSDDTLRPRPLPPMPRLPPAPRSQRRRLTPASALMPAPRLLALSLPCGLSVSGESRFTGDSTCSSTAARVAGRRISRDWGWQQPCTLHRAADASVPELPPQRCGEPLKDRSFTHCSGAALECETTVHRCTREPFAQWLGRVRDESFLRLGLPGGRNGGLAAAEAALYGAPQ